MDSRLNALNQWLDDLWGDGQRTVRPASEDASFRRYFRVVRPGEETAIVMDAPPEKEDLLPFIHVSRCLSEAGLNVPVVQQKNLEQGFLLLTDLGQTPYLSELTPERVGDLYADAMVALSKLQSVGVDSLPLYDETLLRREMDLFTDWFLAVHLDLNVKSLGSVLQESHDCLVTNALEQPQVFVHRDYHSRNLMVDTPNPGILDFQDACKGPITYDLVSLLKDCYVSWRHDQVMEWVQSYFNQQGQTHGLSSVNFEQFFRWFELMGVQRHLKAVGIFARLNYRDGKPHYLPDIPRTLSYVTQVAPKYPALEGLSDLLNRQVLPRMKA